MKIGILVFAEITPMTQEQIDRLQEEADKNGHTSAVLFEKNFRFQSNGNDMEIFYENERFSGFDVILSRPNFLEDASRHQFVVDALVENGYRIINTFPSIGWSKNKIDQHLMLSKAGLPLPRYAITKSALEARAAAEDIQYPIIIKIPVGSLGCGVFYADNPESLFPICDYLTARDTRPLIIEEFVKEAQRTDIRIFVIGGKIAGAMKRSAPENDVRTNASSGGTASVIELTEDEKKLALKTTKLFKLEIAGVDIIRSNRGPLILEINSNPGFTALEEATGINIAGKIIDYAVSSIS
jgi:ribosomal protein S6--L-glutamate ligase